MTISPKAVLLDIEGTTTPIRFVYEFLFPFARHRVSSYLADNLKVPEIRRLLHALHEEHTRDTVQDPTPPAWTDIGDLKAAAKYVQWLMDLDRKSTPLKALQGHIWKDGYRTGQLKAEVFDDVPGALERWAGQGRRVAIFSSGSVLAQRLLFAHSIAGDLTRFINDYFDTTIGPKNAAASYARIADALGAPAGSVLFVSDVTAELAAARAGGLEVLLSLRPGNHPQPDADEYPQIRSLREVPD